jgi:hypothetical protein
LGVVETVVVVGSVEVVVRVEPAVVGLEPVVAPTWLATVVGSGLELPPD